jgi:hypothetical protein
MAGKTKELIDQIIQQKSMGQTVIGKIMITKLLLKGIDISKFTADTPDDPVIIAKVKAIGKEMGVALGF